MKLEKLNKIRALANDPRGDKATRAIAQALLAAHETPQANPWASIDPGLRPSAEYERHQFMDLNNWKRTTNGNPTRLLVAQGKIWRIVIFKFKKQADRYGWMKIDTSVDGEPEFGPGRFESQHEAQEAVWRDLKAS